MTLNYQMLVQVGIIDFSLLNCLYIWNWMCQRPLTEVLSNVRIPCLRTLSEATHTCIFSPTCGITPHMHVRCLWRRPAFLPRSHHSRLTSPCDLLLLPVQIHKISKRRSVYHTQAYTKGDHSLQCIRRCLNADTISKREIFSAQLKMPLGSMRREDSWLG